MNKDTIEGNWKQMKGHVQERWGKLTDDDLTVAAGNTEVLRGKIQERYGIARDEAQKQLDEFMKRDHQAAGNRPISDKHETADKHKEAASHRR